MYVMNRIISFNCCLFVLFIYTKVCQLKKKPNTRISLTRKVDQVSRPASNGWNDRELDDSSNSNSLDGAFIDETATISTLKEKSKLIKCEPDVLKTESELSETVTTNRRKRNRALKAIVTDEPNETDEEKSLNICWNADESFKIKEEVVSPVDSNMSDSGKNITGNMEMPIKTIKTEEMTTVKEEKHTRTTNGSSGKIHEHKPKSKLTSSHCKYCFKKFSNASNLRRHITMSHFGPKKFTCNLCTFRARRQSDILDHMRTKHQFDGERTDALKFVTVNDETVAKPPQSSFSRRKDKHTEVLRDDDEEIYIESEAFVLEESSDQLISLSTSHENSNADVNDDSNNQTNETNKSNSNSKRKGRPKTKDKSKKLDRSISPAEQKDGDSLPARRPVRNRIMPVKKDFVYDLSTLLKKDYKDFQDEFSKQSQSLAQPQSQSQPQPQSQPAFQLTITPNKSRNVSPVTIDNKAPKRRHLLPDTSDSSNKHEQTPASSTSTSTQIETEEMKSDSAQSTTAASTTLTTPLQQSNQTDENATNQNQKPNDLITIKGAAEAMAQQAVQSNRAVFFKPPELPTERPITKPQRQFDSNTMKDWPVLKRPPAIFDGNKFKLSHLKVPGLKRKKRSCLLKHGSSLKPLNHRNRVYEKQSIDTNGHADNRLECNDLELSNSETMKISTKLADKIQLQNAQIESDSLKLKKSIEPEKQTTNNDNSTESIIDKQPENATSTPRRMTLLERLAENKTKKLNESLSRMTIANTDNDSDED